MRRLRRTSLRAAGALLLSLGGAPPLDAQARSELAVSAEAVALEGRYLFGGTVWRGGLAVGAGPHHGLDLSADDADDARVVATAAPVVAWSPGGAARILVSPIAAALLAGGDFLGVYPAAQAGVEVARGRVRIGSLVRVVRIAGPEGTGDYRVWWAPVRVGLAIGG